MERNRIFCQVSGLKPSSEYKVYPFYVIIIFTLLYTVDDGAYLTLLFFPLFLTVCTNPSVCTNIFSSSRVVEVCGGDKFAHSLARIGFIKSSFRWFRRDIYQSFLSLVSSNPTIVKEGLPWINAPVYTLEGEPRQLFDYRPQSKDRPLILNCGSWS